MYFDPEARRMWLDGVKALMTAVNPYTGLSLNDEPALVYVDMHNEQELGIWAAKEPLSAEGVRLPAESAWRSFLKKRYGNDIGRLGKSWNASVASFDAVPLFSKKDLYAWDARGRDANEFLYEIERGMLDFYRQGLEAIGCRTFATLYDVLGYFRFTSIRRDVPGHHRARLPQPPDGQQQSGVAHGSEQHRRQRRGLSALHVDHAGLEPPVPDYRI